MSEKLVESPVDEPVHDEAPPSTDSTTTDSPASEASVWDRWRERRRNRVSRWDRPPPPKDWRYYVGTLGKILIATGLLMFGFVAYQLWGTGIETARAQNALENTFEEQFEAAVAERDSDEPADPDDGISVPDVDTVTPDEPDDPGDASVEPDEPSTAPGIGGAMSDIVPGGIDVSDDVVEQDVPVVQGEAFAKLDIDKIGIDDLYIIPGVKLDDLKKGPGHYPDTPLPGQLGNASLAGHRTTYGAPFFDLDQLAPGDEIVLTMVSGDQYVYSVTGSQVVTAADYHVITTRDPNVAELTLTTCDPKYTARNRLVVHSVLVPERSSQVGTAEFYDFDELETDGGEPADEEIAGDDPTVTVPAEATTNDDATADEAATDDDATDDATTDDDATDDATTGDATVEPDVDEGSGESASPTRDEPAAPTDPDTIDPDSAELDAFSEGWFHDSAAWPQIALWAGVLTLITVLAYQLAKKTRHSSIGLLVGVVPFVVALYFFYQNINRLLPPGL